jgi:hypothetical protein
VTSVWSRMVEVTKQLTTKERAVLWLRAWREGAASSSAQRKEAWTLRAGAG